MSAKTTDLDVVLLVDDDVAELAATLECVTRELPQALVHLVRPGVPAVDALVDQLAGAGLSVIDVPIAGGLPGVLQTVGAALGERRWCYLFGGEQLPAGAGPALRSGAQLTADVAFAWLGSTPAWCGSRVHVHGDVASSNGHDAVQLPAPAIGGTWSMVISRTVRTAFGSFDELIEDISTLAHLDEFDAAYQRAELSWRRADGEHEIVLVRAATLLADLLDLGPASLAAAARWLHLEPEPFVALAYARAAAGAVPFDLLDRLLSRVPRGEVTYHDGTVGMSTEATTRLRHHIERHRSFATTAFESGLRAFGTPDGGPAEAGTFGSALLLGKDPADVVRRLPDDPDLGTRCLLRLRIDLDPRFVEPMLAAMIERFGPHPEIENFRERVAMIERIGVTDDDPLGIEPGARWTADDELIGVGR